MSKKANKKRASISYNIDVKSEQDLNKINTYTKLEYKIEQPNTEAMLETSEIARQAIEAATVSAKSVAESSAKRCSDIIKKQERDCKKINKNRSNMIENIAEAAVATAAAARIAAKIDKYGNNISENDIVSTDDEDTEDLIENLLEKQTIQKTEMSDKRNLTKEDFTEIPKKLEELNNKVEVTAFEIKDKVDNIAEDIEQFNQESVEKIKELVDVAIKNIKKSTNLIIKRGAKTTDIKSRINLIFSDVMQLKSESEIIVHLFKDGLDNIVEDIKLNTGELIELVSHYVFSYFENLVKNVIKLREKRVDLNTIKLELFEELIDQISPVGYKIKDKIDDFYETVMCRGENQAKSYSPNANSKRNSINVSSLDNKSRSPLCSDNLTYNDNIQNFIQIDKIYRKVMEEFERKYEDLNEKFEFSVSRNADINTVREEFKALKNECDNALLTIKEELENVGKSLSEKLENFEESIDNIQKERGEDIEETQLIINGMLNELDTKIESKGEELNKIYEDLQQNTSTYLKNQVSEYKERVDTVGNELKEIGDSILKLTEETEEKFNELTEDIGDEIIEAKNKFKFDLETLMKESITISNDKLIELYEKGMKYKKEIEESNEKSKNDLANYVTTFIENAKTKLNSVFSIQTIENKITTFMNKVFRDNYDISQEKIVKDVIDKSMEKIEDTITKRNTEMVDIYVEFEKLKEELKKFVTEQLEKQHNEFLILLDIQNKLSEYETKFENKLIENNKAFDDKLKALESKLIMEIQRKEPINENEIERIINTKIDAIVNVKKNEIKEFNNHITDKLKNEIEGKFEETSNTIKNNINNYAQTVLERDFIETYESCIDDLNVKIDAVKTVVSTALNGETITSAKLEKILNDLSEFANKFGSVDTVTRAITSQTINNARNFKRIEKKLGK